LEFKGELLEIKCENCHWWKKDYGIWCFNGWSGVNRDDGYCHFDIKKVYKKADDYCSNFAEEK
jgi:hypothetical protein